MVALVEFAPTSSPDLDAIFNKYRETLFIPSVLPEHHRRLIYRESKAPLLLNDPGVTVTLPNDEDMRLMPMKLEDRPVKSKVIPKIMRLMSSSQEDSGWDNLIPFLEGMNLAKEPVPRYFLEQITRRAYEQGKYHIPVRCAELARRTDYRLCYPGLAKQIFTGCHNRAAAAEFQGDELAAAAKQAEYVALLLEKEEHCGGKLKPEEKDARQSVMVVGVLLELAAARALNLDAGKDLDGRVASYLAKALVLSGQGVTPPSFTSEKKRTLSERELEKLDVILNGAFLFKLLPAWHGMKLASKVEGAVTPEIQATLAERIKSLEEHIEVAQSKCRKAPKHVPRRALNMYDQLQSLQS